MRALVVDDNRDLADNVAELLETLGVRVALAATADDAVTEARREHVDLAVIDLRLPGGASGVELVPMLRSVTPGMEIIIVTGNASVDSAAAAVRHGIAAYVEKPFDPSDLLAIAKRALEQVKLRREREALSRELARSEALHRGLVETVDAVILLLDEAGNIVFGNRFGLERVASHVTSLEGQSFLELFVPPEERGRATKTLREVRQGRVLVGVEIPVDGRAGRRAIRWSVRRLDGEGTGRAIAVGIDTTEMLELQRRTLEVEALAAVGQLTTGLAHEIRNPLNAATLQLELLVRAARKLADEPIRVRFESGIGIVRDELSRLQHMLNEFLSMARPRGLDLEKIDLAEVIDDVITLDLPVAESRDVRLESRVPKGALRVEVDVPRIRQVLLNLLANAFDALRDTRGGSVVVSATESEGGFVEVRVEDDGMGLDDIKKDPFQPFVTTKEAGTGLGLPIVRTILERHGGSVSLEPREPRGAVVRFTLPSADRRVRQGATISEGGP